MDERFAGKVRNCLLGAAIGDAMGGPFQKLTPDEKFEAANAIGSDPILRAVRRGITGDGQLMLFTIEGLIRANVRCRAKGLCHPPSVVWHAYLRWLTTQGLKWKQVGGPFATSENVPDGWLVYDRRLGRQPQPDDVTFGMLASTIMGSREKLINSLSTDGAQQLRCVPVGCLPVSDEAARQGLARELVAITHGGNEALEAGAVLSTVIGGLVRGDDLIQALARARSTDGPLRRGLSALVSGDYPALPSPPDQHEATTTLLQGLSWARMHGEFDAIGHLALWEGHGATAAAIAGAVLTAGGAAIDEGFLRTLPQTRLIEQLAADFCLEHSAAAPDLKLPTVFPVDGGPGFADAATPPDWWTLRYPGW